MIVVFRRRYGVGQHDVKEQEVEFDDNATEEEIRDVYEVWLWNQVMDEFTWYKKGEK